ncbi:MAG: UDP-N-acetylmuramoyl-tripeptide--D-alanyl-D-alanine ligase [Firmicutes bacterium]|nr:UDP-N-acetylmuramoyl-tripeptide--D-alanyl-D-alanine ligase [Bacillota bacterium]
MDRIYVRNVVEATGGELIIGSYDSEIDSVCMDSRVASENALFVAIPGERTDGHEYLEAAREKGSSCALVSREVEVPEGMSCVLVENTVKALQELSRWYMSTHLAIKKIAVTGSVGKTTTRDLMFAAVSSKYKVGKNNKNFNSDIGLPLTILTFERDMEVGIMEMGTSGGMEEVAVLADIARPDVAVITNIGVSHIEHLRSRDNILKAKLGIARYFSNENTLIINGNDDKLVSIRDLGEPYKIIAVGTEDALCDVDYLVTNIKEIVSEGLIFNISCEEGEYEVKLPIPGEHNALNAALAIAGAKAVGVSIEDAISGMGEMTTTGSRLRMIDMGGFRIIDDSYNAAPDSMKSAITTLIHGDGEKKIAILGDMNELGTESYKMHFEVGRFAAEHAVDVLLTIGEKAVAIADGAEAVLNEKMASGESPGTIVIRCENADVAYEVLRKIIQRGDIVLFKASRGMALDELVGRIEEVYKNS